MFCRPIWQVRILYKYFLFALQGNRSNGLLNGDFKYGGVCPAGYYCLKGTARPYDTPCRNGTYNNYTGAKSSADCTPCDGGLFCNGIGLNAPIGECRAGWYCISGAKSSMPNDGRTGDICPTKHYCPQGSNTPLPCKAGTYG